MTQSNSSKTKTEQRLDKRTPMACHVFVRGISESGERIKTHAITDNISQGGLFLQTPQALKLGSHVFTITQLLSGARLAARGKVVRVEKKKNMAYLVWPCVLVNLD